MARYGKALLAGAALLAYASVAEAQDISGNSTPQAAEGADANTGEIIVTARRRSESLQTTPVSVTAISPARLEGAAAVSISDLQGSAPNVLISPAPTGAAAANASIRGIGFADVDKSFDPAVGVNVDGVYIGTSTGQLLDFFDIETIEILRGPQGTLFGRNTIAGVINVRRTKPTGEWGLKTEVGGGSYGLFTGKAVLNVPLIKGVLAAKLFEMHDDSDGYYHEVDTGRSRGGHHNDNFGASFLLTPSSSFDALLTLEKQRQRFDPMTSPVSSPTDLFCQLNVGVICGAPGTVDIYQVNPKGPNDGHYTAQAVTLEMNWGLGPVKLNSTTSYRESDEAQSQDYSSAGNYSAQRFQKYHQVSQELRASGNVFTGFDYVAGLYYFDSKFNLTQFTDFLGVTVPYQSTIGTSRSYAGFLDLDWEVLPRVRISGGGRWTHDEKSLQTALGGVLLAPQSSHSWSKFTPKVGIDYRATNNIMGYASWSRGYRSGGFNGRGQTAFSVSTPYNPETVDSYEVGLKTQFFDRKLTFNIAGYMTDYKNMQQSTTVFASGGIGNETIVTNAAKAKIKGVEIDASVKPVHGLTLNSSLGYTDAGFRNFLTSQPVGGVAFPVTFDLSDVNLIFAPKITFSFNGEYVIPTGNDAQFKLNAGYRYISPYDMQIAADPASLPAVITPTTIVHVAQNDPRLRSDHQNLVDASISYIWHLSPNGPKARVTAFVRNALDDRGKAFAFTVSAFPTYFGLGAAREPRVFGGQVGFEF